MRCLILVIGVPASGKSWVCEQLTDKFNYVSHDAHISKDFDMLLRAIEKVPDNKKHILVDCPFGESKLKEKLEKKGFRVFPFFIVESLDVIDARLKGRGKTLSRAQATRASTLKQRAIGWSGPFGTSSHILELLRSIE